jgi:hypothetical protein
MYIEGKSIFVKTGRISLLRDVGSSVKEVKKAGSGCRVANKDGKFSLEMPLTAEKGYTAASYFSICSSPLVKWDTGYVANKALNFDTASQYHFLADGLYNEKPSSYRPNPDTKRAYIYKNVAAWLLNSSSEPNCGSYFELMSTYLLYSTLASYNSEGYIPTQPEADWLLSEFGIGAGFYDTRFNSDTISALIYAFDTHKDTRIKDAVKKALDFYLTFAEKSEFEINGSTYVPDYRAAGGDVSKASCSLNHYLAEALVLIKGSKLLDDDKYKNAGLSILNSIEKNYETWLKDSGDLWYAIRTDGKMEKKDYVSVTYDDLVKTVGVLAEYDILSEYPGINELLKSKEKWLKANGNDKFIKPHISQ